MLQNNVIQYEECWDNLPATSEQGLRKATQKEYGGLCQNMLVKRFQTSDQIKDLEEAFDALRHHQMKLNPTKYILGVTSKFFFSDFLLLIEKLKPIPRK